MKKIGLVFIFMMFFSVCYADVFIIYKTDTKEIYSISENDDAIIPDGYSEEQLKGTIQELGLDLHPTYYRYNNKKFTRNQAKIDSEELQKQQEEVKKQKKEQDKLSAIEKLKVLGLTEDEINALGM